MLYRPILVSDELNTWVNVALNAPPLPGSKHDITEPSGQWANRMHKREEYYECSSCKRSAFCCVYVCECACVRVWGAKKVASFFIPVLFNVTCEAYVHSSSQSLRWRRTDRVRLPVHPLSSENATVRDASQCNSNERAITSVLANFQNAYWRSFTYFDITLGNKISLVVIDGRSRSWLQLFNSIVFVQTFGNQQKWKSCAF